MTRAALASTREQQRLLAAVEDSGARLIEIGDPRQSQPVGAGGLWAPPRTRRARCGAHMELTRNQRARDPADRRDQARFRGGQHEHAIRGYAARDRVHIAPDQLRVENQALDAALRDRDGGKATIVVAQISNEHLDELNARAQAIRQQRGELGPGSFPVPGRPYELHANDEVQIRRTIWHPEHGQLRDGTTAEVGDVDLAARTISLELADGQSLTLDREQAARADLRLAFVQHPFLAQGQTTDTAHLIVGEHATREGSYVALTRARDATHIHAASAADEPSEVDRLQALPERMSRAEPELPSIQTPLAHESGIAAELADCGIDASRDGVTPQLATDQRATEAPGPGSPDATVALTSGVRVCDTAGRTTARERAPSQLKQDPELSPEPESGLDQATAELRDEHPGRAWPRHRGCDPVTSEFTAGNLDRPHVFGWEQ